MVRFADGPTTEVRRVLPCPPEQVWPVITDITLPTARSPELHAVKWAEGHDAPVEGAVFVGHNRRGDLAWSAECVITECDPPHRFTWVPGHRAEHGAYSAFTFLLDPHQEGTEVTQRVRLGPGRSGLTWAIRQDPENEEAIIEARLAHFRRAMAETLEEVAARLALPSG